MIHHPTKSSKKDLQIHVTFFPPSKMGNKIEYMSLNGFSLRRMYVCRLGVETSTTCKEEVLWSNYTL